MGNASTDEDLLERELTEIIVRRLLDDEPEAVPNELRAAAGNEHETLARVSGTVAGFCMNDATAVTCRALIVRAHLLVRQSNSAGSHRLGDP